MGFLDRVTPRLGPKFIQRDVPTDGGENIPLLFRKLGAAEAEKLFLGISKDNPSKNRGLRDKLIAASVFHPGDEGEDPIPCSVKEAEELPNDFANALQDIALEINGITPGEEKKGSEA